MFKVKFNGIEMFIFKLLTNLLICLPVSFLYKTLWNVVMTTLFEFADVCSWQQSFVITFLLILFKIGIHIGFEDIQNIDEDHNPSCALRVTIDIK